jgi:hypothetical protein
MSTLLFSLLHLWKAGTDDEILTEQGSNMESLAKSPTVEPERFLLRPNFILLTSPCVHMNTSLSTSTDARAWTIVEAPPCHSEGIS